MILRKPIDETLILLLTQPSEDLEELTGFLELENFKVKHVTRINDALEFLKNSKTEIVLMDVSGHEVAFLELCHIIKSGAGSRKHVVVVVSDHKDEPSEVAAFRAGADDYIQKPVNPLALTERLKARLHEPQDFITVHQGQNGSSRIQIDRKSYTVYAENKLLNLSKKEFELLYLLASQPGKIFSREEVFDQVWKRKFEESNRTVDVHILRLRKKLGKNSIHTQKGVGYRLTI